MPELGLEPRILASQPNLLPRASSEVMSQYSIWEKVRLGPGQHSGHVTLAWNSLSVSLPVRSVVSCALKAGSVNVHHGHIQ